MKRATPTGDDAQAEPRWIRTSLDVGNLATRIRDSSRNHPIVCVTIPSWASSPLVDANRLAAELGDSAAIFVMKTGDLTWELTALLPPRLDVFGGAVRIWWPGVDDTSEPRAHPLTFVHDRGESETVIAQIVDALERRGVLASKVIDGPQPGTELAGVVSAVRPTGAELMLTGDVRAFARRDELSAAGLEPNRVLRVGQGVRVVVRGAARPGERVPVSLRPRQPDPWRRIGECYEAGMLVDGVVDELRNVGALVTLLPGARGLMRKDRIRPGGVSHPEDELLIGERIVVRIERLDPTEGKAELSWLDIPDDEEPVEALSLYPDGPPWLPPVLEDGIEQELVTAEEPPTVAENPEPETPAEPANSEATQATALPSTGTTDDEDAEPATEVEELEHAITDGYLLRRELEGLVDLTHRRLGELRAEAAEMRRSLERELVEVRLRILEMAEGEAPELVGSTERALAEAREEIAALREQLAAVEIDRRELLDRLGRERARAADAEQAADRLRREVRTRERAVAALEGQIDALGVSSADRFVADVRAAWERLTTATDRERFPWHEPVLGQDLLDSLEQVEGISRSKVVEVCAHVVSGRAATIPGLELHALRERDGGGAPQRVREDGAKAWRCSLQAGTAAARRLHYWQLPDGRIELSKTVYHDDFSIR